MIIANTEGIDKMIRRLKIKKIIKENEHDEAVEKLVEEEMCVSKAEAKRVFYQMGGNK